MKKILLLSFSISIILFACKKKDDNPIDEDVQRVYTLTKILADARVKLLELAPQAGGDPKLALMQTLDWVQQQGDVAAAFQQDSTYLFIETASGLTSMLWVNELDDDGQSRFRGGGSGQIKALTANGGCANVVENKNVLIYSPGEDQFKYDYHSQVPERLQSEDIIENVDFLKNEQASIEKISTFSNYGLVLMETHGSPISFLTGDGFSFNQPNLPTDYIEFRDAVLNEIGQQYFNQILAGKLQVGGKVTYDPLDINWWSNGQEDFEAGYFELWVTTKFLENLPPLDNTIVYGNFCYSGWTAPTNEYPTPIGQAFLNKNPITYYAYRLPNNWSKPADNLQCIQMEDSLTRRLIIDIDSTGIAHRKANGSPFNFDWPTEDLQLVQLGQSDWCYGGCDVGELVDGRDGQVYRTVTIGNQTWMAENLRYLPFVHTDSEFADASDNEAPAYGVYGYSGTSVVAAVTTPGYETYGVLYNWYAAVDACPSGWHLPTKQEWTELASFTGLLSEAGGKLKSQDYWDPPSVSTDEYCFTAVPCGERGEHIGDFREKGLHGKHWTSTEVSTGIAIAAGYTATASSHQSGNTSMGTGKACRCVKD